MRHFSEQDMGKVDGRLASEGDVPSLPPLPTTRASRRAFLSRGIAAAAVPAAVAVGSGLASAATTTSPFPSYYTGSTKRNFQEIQADEFQHINIITNLILSLGGTPRPLPTFVNLTNLSVGQFLSYSVAFENTGVGAYLGALPYVSNPKVVIAAAEIALIEAYHSGFLNTLANLPLVPNAASLAAPLTQAQIVNAISPFVANLNDNGLFPPSFGTTPSAANDIEILNFALLLEDLEAEFYYYNVPIMFP